jgi:hypothetical protein
MLREVQREDLQFAIQTYITMHIIIHAALMKMHFWGI